MTDSPSASDAPLVVVTGLPRSGTSMMMRMLEAGGVPVIVDGLRKADLDNPNGYYEHESVKSLKQDSSWVRSARGKAVKMVCLLLYDLPLSLPYSVIFMRRNLEEIVSSQDEMLRHRGACVSPDESSRLIVLFQAELRAVEQWLAARRNFRVLYVDYNQTVSKPDEACAKIKRFLNWNLDVDKMQSVVTSTLYRQRRMESGNRPI